jgi:hypothetical protein
MNRAELFEKAKKLAGERITETMGQDEKMETLEIAMMELLDLQIMQPAIGRIGTFASGGVTAASGRWLMGDDPRLPTMPEKPTLMDFFRLRFMLDKRGSTHLMQSAKLAKDKGIAENLVLACLLHDISVVAFIRNDHGYWGAQMVEPYVDEEVTWAIKHHQALRFLPAPEYGYEYPKLYAMAYGEDYVPPDYIKQEWENCRGHKWYESAMQVVMNDFYAFDPNMNVELEEFAGIIERNFRQPTEGLGFDGSPVAHMWRTLIWPNNFL